MAHLLLPSFGILPLSPFFFPLSEARLTGQEQYPTPSASESDYTRARDQQQFLPGSAHAVHRRLLDFQAKNTLSKLPHKNDGLSQGARSLAA